MLTRGEPAAQGQGNTIQWSVLSYLYLFWQLHVMSCPTHPIAIRSSQLQPIKCQSCRLHSCTPPPPPSTPFCSRPPPPAECSSHSGECETNTEPVVQLDLLAVVNCTTGSLYVSHTPRYMSGCLCCMHASALESLFTPTDPTHCAHPVLLSPPPKKTCLRAPNAICTGPVHHHSHSCSTSTSTAQLPPLRPPRAPIDLYVPTPPPP